MHLNMNFMAGPLMVAEVRSVPKVSLETQEEAADWLNSSRDISEFDYGFFLGNLTLRGREADAERLASRFRTRWEEECMPGFPIWGTGLSFDVDQVLDILGNFLPAALAHKAALFLIKNWLTGKASIKAFEVGYFLGRSVLRAGWADLPERSGYFLQNCNRPEKMLEWLTAGLDLCPSPGPVTPS